MSAERKYVLTRLGAGDYLLPSNDAKVIWRIRRYEEGPSHGLMDWPRDLEVWGIWRWQGKLEEVDPEDWARWGFWEGIHDTRAAAIKSALTARPDKVRG